MIKKKNSKKNNAKDPYFAQEQAQYDSPIPSREFIITTIQSEGSPLSSDQLSQKLRQKSTEEKNALKKRLQAMHRDNQLIRNSLGSYKVNPKNIVIEARVEIGRNQTVSLVCTQQKDRTQFITLNARQAQSVMQGDIVLARYTNNPKERRQTAVLVEITKRANNAIVGQLGLINHRWIVHTMSPQCAGMIKCEVGHEAFSNGDFVKAEIIEYPSRSRACRVRVIEKLGELDSPDIVRDVMINTYHLPGDFSQDAINEAEAINKVGVTFGKEREDWRDRNFITIDGDDARDFDDAISVRKVDAGWELIVAISDVSHYIKTDTHLDHEAYDRATSVYLPNVVLPMLPPVLSDGLCSLCPHVDRLVKAVSIQLTENGSVKSYQFYKAVICSKARVTYGQAQKIIDKKADDKKWLCSLLDEAHQLYKLLDQKRKKRGALEIDLPFTQLVFDKNNKIESIMLGKRNVSHKIIEEFMLLANELTAEWLLSQKRQALFRNHNQPDFEKVHSLNNFLKNMGIITKLQKGQKIATKQIQSVIYSLGQLENGEIYVPMVLSVLAQACYEEKNKGHFGLAYEHYCHFTSPIRRYPDLIVHRSLDELLTDNKEAKKLLPEAVTMLQAGRHCSSAERVADEAQKKSAQWLKCYFMKDKVGDCYDATISSIRSFGIFITINQYHIDGLVHITMLNGYYRYDESKITLTRDTDGQTFSLGQPVKVLVKKVNVLEQTIDLEIISA